MQKQNDATGSKNPGSKDGSYSDEIGFYNRDGQTFNCNRIIATLSEMSKLLFYANPKETTKRIGPHLKASLYLARVG